MSQKGGAGGNFYNDTSPTLRGVAAGAVRYFNNEPPRTKAGQVVMNTVSNAPGGTVPNSNKPKNQR